MKPEKILLAIFIILLVATVSSIAEHFRCSSYYEKVISHKDSLLVFNDSLMKYSDKLIMKNNLFITDSSSIIDNYIKFHKAIDEKYAEE